MHTAITWFNTKYGRDRLDMKRRLRTSGDTFAELTQKDGFFDELERETGITRN